MLHWLALYSVTWAVKVKNNINEWQHHDSDSLEKIDFLINTESSNLAHHQRRNKLPHDATEGVVEQGRKREPAIPLGIRSDSGVRNHAGQEEHTTAMAAHLEDAALEVHLKATDLKLGIDLERHSELVVVAKPNRDWLLVVLLGNDKLLDVKHDGDLLLRYRRLFLNLDDEILDLQEVSLLLKEFQLVGRKRA